MFVCQGSAGEASSRHAPHGPLCRPHPLPLAGGGTRPTRRREVTPVTDASRSVQPGSVSDPEEECESAPGLPRGVAAWSEGRERPLDEVPNRDDGGRCPTRVVERSEARPLHEALPLVPGHGQGARRRAEPIFGHPPVPSPSSPSRVAAEELAVGVEDRSHRGDDQVPCAIGGDRGAGADLDRAIEAARGGRLHVERHGGGVQGLWADAPGVHLERVDRTAPPAHRTTEPGRRGVQRR